MNFAEVRFWELLVGGLMVILCLRFACSKRRPQWLLLYDKCGLLSLGLFLLLCVDWLTFSIFLGVALGTFFGLKWILKSGTYNARKYLWVLIPLQLLPLFYYKYSIFFFEGVLRLHYSFLHTVAIPVGISFYTFQKVAFVLDTLAFQQPLPRFLDFMNFAGFFPQIVAGPIERKKSLLPQMESFRFQWNVKDLNEGCTWIAVGFFFKCALADNLAGCFNSSSSTNAYLIWLANLVFGLRIYYDFAGYSLIALGIARCLGVRLTLNFASPYCSLNITEFWRRWHITLSQWFRDYLYIPLGGSRVKWWAFNLILVFLVSGVWHGAGWNFVFWGGFHALFLLVNRLCGQTRMPAVIGWFLTMVGCFAAWLCFYESDTHLLLKKLTVIAAPGSYSKPALTSALQELPPNIFFVTACTLAFAFCAGVVEWASLKKKKEPYYYFRKPEVACAMVVLTVILAPGGSNGFIYFAF
jgi:alginate O-acetyltransferase complex protein AlgI